MNAAVCLILSTAGSREEAERIAELLVSRRLAACVQLLPITSFYTWQGKLNRDAEVLLLMKTTAECYPALESAIRENHSYEIPEILRLPVEGGLAAYLAWVSDNTRDETGN